VNNTGAAPSTPPDRARVSRTNTARRVHERAARVSGGVGVDISHNGSHGRHTGRDGFGGRRDGGDDEEGK
jgi:hypothetical protein